MRARSVQTAQRAASANFMMLSLHPNPYISIVSHTKFESILIHTHSWDSISHLDM